jgi:hypothetical protein
MNRFDSSCESRSTTARRLVDGALELEPVAEVHDVVEFRLGHVLSPPPRLGPLSTSITGPLGQPSKDQGPLRSQGVWGL